MSKHFLLASEAHALSLATVARMSDEEARKRFAEMRLTDNGGEATCPRCACTET